MYFYPRNQLNCCDSRLQCVLYSSIHYIFFENFKLHYDQINLIYPYTNSCDGQYFIYMRLHVFSAIRHKWYQAQKSHTLFNCTIFFAKSVTNDGTSAPATVAEETACLDIRLDDLVVDLVLKECIFHGLNDSVSLA